MLTTLSNQLLYGLCCRRLLFKSMSLTNSNCLLVRKKTISADKIEPIYKLSNLSYTYEDAIKHLNNLQCSRTLTRGDKLDGKGLLLMKQLLYRTELTDDDLSNLNIIHVTGTKGKGSTCAFVESILIKNGVKTGFFSSPHLVEVRERIRINGKAISRELFAYYYWKVIKALEETKDKYMITTPSYFYFLTTLAFYVFKHENVDAAIMEVGIGGAFDCTNVVKKPTVCAVSTLDIDHVTILGNTIEKIAWQKAGIFKPGVNAYTVQQNVGGLEVLKQRAKELGSHLTIVPPIKEYEWTGELSLGLSGQHQKVNASLATQICKEWLKKIKNYNEESKKLNKKFLQGLAACKFNGRSHVVKANDLTFYLDGAHTSESINCASKWFILSTKNEEAIIKKNCEKVLVFNVTHGRDPKVFLEILYNCNFDYVIFVPNVATLKESKFSDQNNLANPLKVQMNGILENQRIWKLIDKRNSESQLFNCVADAVKALSKGKDQSLFYKSCSLTTSSVSTTYPENKHLQIFVVGSFHLVGAFLAVIQPNLNEE